MACIFSVYILNNSRNTKKETYLLIYSFMSTKKDLDDLQSNNHSSLNSETIFCNFWRCYYINGSQTLLWIKKKDNEKKNSKKKKTLQFEEISSLIKTCNLLRGKTNWKFEFMIYDNHQLI